MGHADEANARSAARRFYSSTDRSMASSVPIEKGRETMDVTGKQEVVPAVAGRMLLHCRSCWLLEQPIAAFPWIGAHDWDVCRNHAGARQPAKTRGAAHFSHTVGGPSSRI